MSEDTLSSKIAEAMTETPSQETQEVDNKEVIDTSADIVDNENEEQVEEESINNVDNSETTISKSETKEEIVEEETESKEESVEPSFDFSKFNELTGEEFDSVEAIVDKIKSFELRNENRDPFIVQLEKYREDGITITPEFLKQVSVDWGSKDPKNPSDALQIIESKLKIENPDLDPDEVQYLMDEYSFDETELRANLEDKFNDEDLVNKKLQEAKSRHEMKLRVKAKEAKPTLEKYQQSLTQPQGKSKEALMEEARIQTEDYNKEIYELTKDYNTYSIKNGEESIDIELGKELQKTVRQDMKDIRNNPDKFWNKVNGKEGLKKMITLLHLEGKIAEEIGNRKLAEGTHKAAKEIKNQKPHTDKGSEFRGSSQTAKIADAMMA